MNDHELVSPDGEAGWRAFHDITRDVLFERRGQIGVYDPSLIADGAPGQHPKLLMFRGEPVGVIRIDIDGVSAIFRRVAIRADLHRRGHGRRLVSLSEEFAASQGCRMLTSHVAMDAVGFYEKCGFRVDTTEPQSVLMSKPIALGPNHQSQITIQNGSSGLPS